MTDEQKRARIEEINKERDRLAKERQEYIDYFKDVEKEFLFKEHQKYIGKCFLINSNSKSYNHRDSISNDIHSVKAFKVLNVLDYPREYEGLCLALIDDCSIANCGILLKTLPLWLVNKLVPKESDPKLIDYYEEISHTEFNILYGEMLEKINYKQEANNENT